MGRSYLAFVLAPELPLVDWLVELDRRVESSLSFFANRPLVLDLVGISPTKAETSEIIAFIEERGLRLIAVEGVPVDWLPERLAPLPGKVQAAGMFQPPEEGKPSRPEPPSAAAWQPETATGVPCAALLVSEPVRSGQSIIYPHGDVIILVRLHPELKSSPAAPSMFMAACAAGPLQGPMAIPTRAFSVANLMPRSW